MVKSKKNTSHKQNNKTKKCEVKKCEVYTKFEENFKSIPISADNEINRIFKKAIAPTTLKPQDDYYSYINYKWLQNVKNEKGQEYIYQLDDFRFVQHKVFNELIHIIDDYTKHDKSIQAKEMLKLKNSYTKGISKSVLKNYANNMLSEIDELRSDPSNLWKLLGTMNQNEFISWGVPIKYALLPDDKNPTIYRCNISGPVLSIIDFDVYFDDDTTPKNKVTYVKNYKRKYLRYLEDLFAFVFGKNHGFDVNDIYLVEKKIINMYSCLNKTDEEAYNVIKKKESKETYNFDWESFSKHLGFKETPDFFITSAPQFIQCCSTELLKDWTNADWRTYFIYIYIRQLIRLNQDGYNLYYSFNGKFAIGQRKQVDDKLGAFLYLSLSYNSFLTNEYVSRYKNEKAISYLENLADDLRIVFIRIIERNTWLAPKTKKYALLKLKHLKLIVGSPTTLRVDPVLDYSDDDAWENLNKIIKWRFEQGLKLEGKHTIDIPDIDWTSTPPKFNSEQAYVVNASYTASKNQIYIPLGIIQKPFVDIDRGVEYNLGNIGYILGHEMSHALDNWGSKYDHTGKLSDWWTEADKKKYKKIQDDVIEQYRVFAKYDGIDFDATYSIGENLADISGLSICRMYLRDIHEHNKDLIPIRAMSYEAFFIYYTYQMKQKMGKNVLKTQLLINPHPPDKYRTNVPLSRFPIFRTIYNIKKGDKMYWKSTSRIWLD